MNIKKYFFMVIVSVSALCPLQIQPFWNFTHNFWSFFNSDKIRNFPLYPFFIVLFPFFKSYFETEANIQVFKSYTVTEENILDEYNKDPIEKELYKEEFSRNELRNIFKEHLLFQLSYPGDTISKTYNHVFNVSPSGKIKVIIEQDDDIPYHAEDECKKYSDLENFVDRVHHAVFTSKSKKTRERLSGNCIFKGRKYRLTIAKSKDFCNRVL